MNNQEFERKMNFIVEQQAQFAADLELRRIREEEFDRRHQTWKVEIEDLLTRLARATKEGFNDVNAKINALVDSQIRLEEQKKTDEQLRRTAEQVRANAEQQRKTDEQLRRTDELLRRHLGGNRNSDKN